MEIKILERRKKGEGGRNESGGKVMRNDGVMKTIFGGIGNVTRALVFLLLMCLQISRVFGSGSGMNHHYGQLLKDFVYLTVNDPASSCACRVTCLLDNACTAVTVKDISGAMKCLYSKDSTVTKANLEGAHDSHTWIKDGETSITTSLDSTTDSTATSGDSTTGSSSSTTTTEVSTSTSTGPGVTTATTATEATASTTTITPTTTTSTTTITPTTTTSTTTTITTSTTTTTTTTVSATDLDDCGSPKTIGCLFVNQNKKAKDAWKECGKAGGAVFVAKTKESFLKLQTLIPTLGDSFKKDLIVGIANHKWTSFGFTRELENVEWDGGNKAPDDKPYGMLKGGYAVPVIIGVNKDEDKDILCIHQPCSEFFPVVDNGQIAVCSADSWAEANVTCKRLGSQLYLAETAAALYNVRTFLMANEDAVTDSNLWVDVFEGIWGNGRVTEQAEWKDSAYSSRLEANRCGALERSQEFKLRKEDCIQSKGILCQKP